MTDRIEPLGGLRQDAEKRSPVAFAVAEDDTAPLVDARRRMIERAGRFQPEGVAIVFLVTARTCITP